MIIDNTMMSVRGKNIGAPLLRIEPLKGRINFSMEAVKMLKTDPQHLYFRFRVIDKKLYIVPGKVPTAIKARIHLKNGSCGMSDKSIVALLMKQLGVTEGGVKLKLGDAIEQRYEGFLQFPLNII